MPPMREKGLRSAAADWIPAFAAWRALHSETPHVGNIFSLAGCSSLVRLGQLRRENPNDTRVLCCISHVYVSQVNSHLAARDTIGSARKQHSHEYAVRFTLWLWANVKPAMPFSANPCIVGWLFGRSHLTKNGLMRAFARGYNECGELVLILLHSFTSYVWVWKGLERRHFRK